jgi:hypothetical protein
MVQIWPNIYVPSYFICLRKARLVLDTSTTKARLQTKTRQHHSDKRPIHLFNYGDGVRTGRPNILGLLNASSKYIIKIYFFKDVISHKYFLHHIDCSVYVGSPNELAALHEVHPAYVWPHPSVCAGFHGPL